MAWTNPRTWVAGDPVTAAQLNEQVRDNLTAVRSAGLAVVGILATPTIPTSEWTTVDWQFEVVDSLASWALSPNPSRLTPSLPGKYLINGRVMWKPDATSTGSRRARLLMNNTLMLSQDVRPGMNATQNNSVVGVQEFNGSTDYVELQAFHTMGSGLDLSNSDGVTALHLVWLGA